MSYYFFAYIKSELAIVVLVMWFLGWLVKYKMPLSNRWIPLILLGVSTGICSIYVFATSPIANWRDALMCLFASVTQGILCAACAVFGDQLIKQANKPD